MNYSWAGFVAGLVVIAVTGCAYGPPKLPGPTEGRNVLVEDYRIDVGDQISISVWKNPELSISAPVLPDGKIAVPLVGDIVAAGRTPEELGELIEQELSSYVKNPNVTVTVTGLQGHQFLSQIRVTGAVGNNSSMTYHQGMTIFDAVLNAGGMDIYADGNNTKLHRRADTGTETYDIRLQDIFEDGDMTTNVLLVPGDIITVPERAF